VNEFIAVTENDAPKQYKLSPFILVIAIAFLAIGEALAGTSVYFVAMMASTMLCIGITYNILGGLGSIDGIAFSIFALNTFVISQFAKVILFESAIQNLEAPQLTITVYLLFYFSVMVGTFVFGRARLPLPKALEPSTDKQMNLMYLFSLVVGTLATFIFAGGELLTGGGDEGTSHSFAVGFQGLLLFAVVLAVQSRLRRSNGLHSVDMKVLIPWIVLIVFGLLNTERIGVIRPAFAYALTCHLNGFEFKRKHYIWAVAGIVAFVTIISPYFIYSRSLGLALGGKPFLEKSQEVFHLLTTPTDWTAVAAASSVAEGSGEGRSNYYSLPGTFVLSRLSLIRVDSNMISTCSGGYHYGFQAVKIDALMMIPHFLYRDKPTSNSGTIIGHVTGLTSDETENSYAGISAIGDTYGGFGLLGVALVGLFVFPSLFIVYESIFDIRRPWGIVALGTLGSHIMAPLGAVITLAIREPIDLLLGSYLIGILVKVIPTRGSR
jgi:hypothetical protein